MKVSNRRRTLQSVLAEEPAIAIPDELERAFRAHHGLVFRTAYRAAINAALDVIRSRQSDRMVAVMLFRNPILPAGVILVWEAVNPFLPALLKKFSVIYYLKSLCPVEIPSPPGMPPLLVLLISNSDPVSAPFAVLGVVMVGLLAIYVSSVQVRRMEINYTTE